MPSISNLYVVEVSTDDQPIRWMFGALLECQGEMLDQQEKDPARTWSVREARRDDVEAQILALQEKRKAAQFAYDYSAWAMGPTYRRQIAEIEDRIRLFRSYIENPSTPLLDGQAPAELPSPGATAGAAMTLSEACDAVMRPETDDLTLLMACRVIDRESRDPFFREIADRMISHFESRMLEVEG